MRRRPLPFWPAGMPAVAQACVTRALETRMPACVRRRPSRFPVTPATIRSLRSEPPSDRVGFAGAPWTCSPRLPKPAGHIDRFGRFTRTLARWHARRRTLAANRNAIIARGRRGVLVGFLSSAAWTATIGLLMGSVATWATGEIDWFSTTLATASMVGAVAAVAGILGGWWLGRAAGSERPSSASKGAGDG